MLSIDGRRDRRVGHVDHGELLGLRRQRSVADQVLDGSLELRIAGAAAVEPDEVAGADERVGMRLQGGRARERRGHRGEATGHPHGADDLARTAVGPWTSPPSNPVSKRK